VQNLKENFVFLLIFFLLFLRPSPPLIGLWTESPYQKKSSSFVHEESTSFISCST